MTDIAAIHKQILEGAWSGGDDAIIDQVYSDEYTFTGPLDRVSGRDGERSMIAGYVAAFPDLQFTVHEQLVDRDRVASRSAGVGPQAGALAPFPATGRTGEPVTGVSIARFESGKLVDAYTMWDVFGLLTQLGHLPAPAAAR